MTSRLLKGREDLKESLTTAQTNAVGRQEGQADLYNKKTKGHIIVEGDRVLMANKGECGHRKLVGRWNPPHI